MRVGGVVRSRVRQPEHREHRIADILFDGAAAGEDLRRYPLVELAQHRHDGLRRHLFGHPGEADDVDEEDGDGLAPHLPQLVVLGENLGDVRRKISREVSAGALGRGAAPVELAHATDLIEGLADRDFEIGEIDGLGDEIEGAAVHRGADVGHVAIGGNDDRPHWRLPLAQDGEQREPVHDRHVDVEQQQVNVGLGRDRRQRFLAMVGKAEFEFPGADLTAEALSDQPFDVGFVVDGQNFGWAGHRHPA